ncbi:MAG: hypothetical protein ACKOW2_03775 [Sphingobacteriaceae bacterium]
MSDISFSGLGSFVLFLFTTIFFGFVMLALLIRQILINATKDEKAIRLNILLFKSALFPFVIGIVGLICIDMVKDQSIKRLFDSYISVSLVVFGLTAGITWLIFQLKNKPLSAS